jgi:CHRD domain
MNDRLNKGRLGTALAAVSLVAVAGCAMMKGEEQKMVAMSHSQSLTLSGANEVPAVASSATGTGSVTVNPDRTVSAKITVTGMTGTASHIHEGAPGTNGKVIVPFTKTGDNTFVAPEGAKMTEDQYAACKAGNTYVNVHSAKNPGGEIRAQLTCT